MVQNHNIGEIQVCSEIVEKLAPRTFKFHALQMHYICVCVCVYHGPHLVHRRVNHTLYMPKTFTIINVVKIPRTFLPFPLTTPEWQSLKTQKIVSDTQMP